MLNTLMLTWTNQRVKFQWKGIHLSANKRRWRGKGAAGLFPSYTVIEHCTIWFKRKSVSEFPVCPSPSFTSPNKDGATRGMFPCGWLNWILAASLKYLLPEPLLSLDSWTFYATRRFWERTTLWNLSSWRDGDLRSVWRLFVRVSCTSP